MIRSVTLYALGLLISYTALKLAFPEAASNPFDSRWLYTASALLAGVIPFLLAMLMESRRTEERFSFEGLQGVPKLGDCTILAPGAIAGTTAGTAYVVGVEALCQKIDPNTGMGWVDMTLAGNTAPAPTMHDLVRLF